jgi:hypothetical protein
MNFVLKHGDGLLMLGHNARRAALAGGRRDRWAGSLGNP